MSPRRSDVPPQSASDRPSAEKHANASAEFGFLGLIASTVPRLDAHLADANCAASLRAASPLKATWFGPLQSWIDPGAAAGGEDGRTGLIAGAGVAGAASDGAGIVDAVLGGGPDFMAGLLDAVLGSSDFIAGIMEAAFGGGSDFMDGVSTRVSWCLWGGLNRVSGGLPGGGG